MTIEQMKIKLKVYAATSGKSQKVIAEELGLKYQGFRNWLSGSRNYSEMKLARIGNYLQDK